MSEKLSAKLSEKLSAMLQTPPNPNAWFASQCEIDSQRLT